MFYELSFLLSCLILSGCATFADPPDFPENTNQHILDIQKVIHAELKRAIAEIDSEKNKFVLSDDSKKHVFACDKEWLKGWRFSAQLELRREKTLSANPEVGIQRVLGSNVGNLFDLGADFTGSTETFKQGEANISGTIDHLLLFIDDKDVTNNNVKEDLFKGDIGIADWINSVSETANALIKQKQKIEIRFQEEEKSKEKCKDKYKYKDKDKDKDKITSNIRLGTVSTTIRFTYIQSADVNPEFTLVSFGFGQVVPQIALRAARERIYQLVLTLSPPSGPSRVEITSFSDSALEQLSTSTKAKRSKGLGEPEIGSQTEASSKSNSGSFTENERRSLERGNLIRGDIDDDN